MSQTTSGSGHDLKKVIRSYVLSLPRPQFTASEVFRHLMLDLGCCDHLDPMMRVLRADYEIVGMGEFCRPSGP